MDRTMKTAVICLFLLSLLSMNSYAETLSSPEFVKSDSGMIEVDGGRLFYEAAGKGKCIVLLHYGILHHVIWDEQFPVLAEHYRVIRYDCRGFGKSTPPQAPFSNVDDLNQLFMQLNIEKAILFGMSGGGALAIDFTLKYPERVSALVLSGA